MTHNILIGLGNTGTQIVKEAAKSSKLYNVKMYAIDSVSTAVDVEFAKRVNFVPIISDDKTGSGRSRERGAAMFRHHQSIGSFKEMYADIETARTPILVVTSAAGGTGSGSAVPLCRDLIQKGLHVIPIIVCPAMQDPDAFHLNTNDLMLELEEAGIKTYTIFRNEAGNADYRKINGEIVEAIEIILGQWYDETDLDSIDDSDLDVILSTPGRFIAARYTSANPDGLRRSITGKVINGSQPGWSSDESENNTFMTAFSLTGPYASEAFEATFHDINARIKNRFDEYRNISIKDGDWMASVIIAGLPRAELKEISSEFRGASSIAHGVKKSARPNFMNNRGLIKPTAQTMPRPTVEGSTDLVNKTEWK